MSNASGKIYMTDGDVIDFPIGKVTYGDRFIIFTNANDSNHELMIPREIYEGFDD